MTAEQIEGEGQADELAPQLVHAGTYALYETPDGGRHLVYRRCQSVNEAGELLEVENAGDEHLPTIPPEALPLIGQFLENGIPAPVMAVLRGKSNPLTALRGLASSLGPPDEREAAEHVHIPGDPPCPACGYEGAPRGDS